MTSSLNPLLSIVEFMSASSFSPSASLIGGAEPFEIACRLAMLAFTALMLHRPINHKHGEVPLYQIHDSFLAVDRAEFAAHLSPLNVVSQLAEATGNV